MSKKEVKRDQVLGHADEADGIEEYDNPLPDWWLGLFYFTIFWALVYGVYYHFIGHSSQYKTLAAEVAEAKERWPASSAPTTVALTKAAIEAGQAIFTANCTACHGEDMKGKIGPNLLDSIWIHGGKPADIVKTITEGVPAKGMLTWGPILGPEKINQVAAYVISRNHEALGIHDEPGEAEEPAGKQEDQKH
jgi:cytochrome c oxidase cbb3-type subunit 3